MTDRLITPEQWRRWIQDKWAMIPYVLRFEPDQANLPQQWKHAWEQASPYSFVLESGKEGRYTYLGLQPSSVLEGTGLDGSITDLHSGMKQYVQGEPLDLMQQWMSEHHAPKVQMDGIPPFMGGCVGFLGYDVVRSLEELPVISADDHAFPDYMWMRLEEVWIYDAEEKAVFCVVHIPWTTEGEGVLENEHNAKLHQLYLEAATRAEQMQVLWKTISAQTYEPLAKAPTDNQLTSEDQGQWPGMSSRFSPEDFEQAVLTIQEYIRQGDVFQVNLSLRQERQIHSSPERIYEWLRLLNPSPYMGMLRSPEFTLVSASPELLVKLDGERVSARPIAGTRRRGNTAQEDTMMATELRTNEKERAEHIMLVDLERNDIGRIAAYGSVHVPELMSIEYYSHVMHLVSQVEGRIARGKNAFDVIAALFPGGTITGAPKIRTMEIIEELEPVRRGPYTGSMGWIDYNGNMELNIIIRTLAVSGGVGYIQSGAGIVIDSDPYREYRECHNKAKAMIKAVLCSEEEMEAAQFGRAKGMGI